MQEKAVALQKQPQEHHKVPNTLTSAQKTRSNFLFFYLYSKTANLWPFVTISSENVITVIRAKVLTVIMKSVVQPALGSTAERQRPRMSSEQILKV